MAETYAIRERIDYIAQQNVLPADLTVLENRQFFASVQGVSLAEQKRRIPELLGFAGLGNFTQRLAGRLSGGMKKKLALACSLIHELQVVLIDEPTLGVDPISRRDFWTLLYRMAKEGVMVLVTTHYMDEAERCQRIGFMSAGRLVALDTPARLKQKLPERIRDAVLQGIGTERKRQ